MIDITRLIWGAWERTPRGIDRIDFGYAATLAKRWPGQFLAIASTPWGLRIFDRSQVIRHLHLVSEAWRESASWEADDRFAAVTSWLLNRAQTHSVNEKNKDRAHVLRISKMIWGEPFNFGKRASAIADPFIYLNVGQSTFGRPDITKWLRKHPRCKIVAMIHDIIPIEHPELVPPDNTTQHQSIMQAIAEISHLVITPTQTVAQSILHYLTSLGNTTTKVYGSLLPLEQTFYSRHKYTNPSLSGMPYFIASGAIEIRKNQQFLLDVWKQLLLQLRDDTPALILAGSVGYGGRAILSQLSQNQPLQKYVVISEGLSSQALACLITNAKALLMPSLAEGFGLPTIEALALGTPAFISDIPAHREATKGVATYLSPTSIDDWCNCIAGVATSQALLQQKRQTTRGFVPQNWTAYIDDIITQLVA